MLALGRLGGRALTHASDLDLIYLFDAPDGARSDGATARRDRLLQPPGQPDRRRRCRSRPRPARLYDVDTRLRPQGAQGMLAVSLDAFAAYQRDRGLDVGAYGAVPRARPLTGDPALPGQGRGR